jgi:hypothetical protein
MTLTDPTKCIISTVKNGKPLDITLIKKRTALETVIHIFIMFCRMLGIKVIELVDVSEKNMYKLLYYRVFLTNKPLSDLSIYSKFFKKITYLCDKNEKKIIQILDEIRHYDSKLIFQSAQQSTLSEYFSKNENFNIPENSSLSDIIKIKMKQIDDVVEILSKTEKYKIFFECISKFTVKVDDYIPSILLLNKNKFKPSPKNLKPKPNAKIKA